MVNHALNMKKLSKSICKKSMSEWRWRNGNRTGNMGRILDANYPLGRDGCCDSLVRLYDPNIQAGNKKGEINMMKIPQKNSIATKFQKKTTSRCLYHLKEWV
jgi:hypothetical protein